MKVIFLYFFLTFGLLCPAAFAQSTELQLAQQYSANGEPEKAYDIYQKLYKQDNDAYYSFYIGNLLALKKWDEAESVTKKMLRKNPGNPEYVLKLGAIYTQQGNAREATALYEDLIKKMPAEQPAIAMLAMQFYQNGDIDNAIYTFKQGRKLLNTPDVFAYELITLYRAKREKLALVDEYLNFLPANPGYAEQAQSAIAALFDSGSDYEQLRTVLFRKIQKEPQQAVFAQMLIWLFLQQKEYDQALSQALALNRRTNGDDNIIFDLCRTLNDNEAYDAAIRGYEYIIAKGKDNQLYISARGALITTKGLKITSGKYIAADLLALEKDYQDILLEFGKNRNTVFAMPKLANLQAFKLHKLADAQKTLEEAIKIPGVSRQVQAWCKLDLGDILLLNNQPWEATLLYSQVEKDLPDSELEQDAKLRNAKMAYYTGDFVWAKGQLGVLKAATTKLIANDALNLQLLIADNTKADSAGNALKMYARADLQLFANQPEKALKILDSIDKKFPDNTLADDILMAKAKLKVAAKDYAAAVTYLKEIVKTHPEGLWGDDAIFMLGDIYENNLNDKAQAQTYYQKIITDYSGSLWLNEARKRFRTLRGDTGA